jgi:hypothetical protein
MKTIWKWKLGPETTIDMPHGAKLLAVQDQNGEPHLWALVDPSAKTYPRTFRVYGTGHNMPDEPGQYVGTVQMQGGAMVVHVFEANGALCGKNASGQPRTEERDSRIDAPHLSPFRYLIAVSFADDGPYTETEYSSDTPVAVGHQIAWAWNPENPKDEMRLVVTGICHRNGRTILNCDYDDYYYDGRLVDTCVKMGMPNELAEETPRAIRKIRAKRALAERRGMRK